MFDGTNDRAFGPLVFFRSPGPRPSAWAKQTKGPLAQQRLNKQRAVFPTEKITRCQREARVTYDSQCCLAASDIEFFRMMYPRMVPIGKPNNERPPMIIEMILPIGFPLENK